MKIKMDSEAMVVGLVTLIAGLIKGNYDRKRQERMIDDRVNKKLKEIEQKEEEKEEPE